MKLGNIAATLLVTVTAFAASLPSAYGLEPRHQRPPQDFRKEKPMAVTNGAFGLVFGYVNSLYRTKEWVSGDVSRTPSLNGFNIGLDYDFSLIRNTLYFQVGLNYTYLNDSYVKNVVGIDYTGDWNEHYLNLPIRVKCDFRVHEKIRLFAYAGPTISQGLSSKLSYRGRVGEAAVGYSYNYFNGKSSVTGTLDEAAKPIFEGLVPDNAYRSFDVLMGGAIGAEFLNLIEVSVGFDGGLVNKIKKSKDSGNNCHRHQFYVNLGFRF